MELSRKLVVAAYVAPFLLFAAVYLPAAGHGLIQDDYSWILRSRVRSVSDFVDLFRSDNGFYRPIVSLTFSINEWMFGAHPLGYGLTNVALALGCAGAIVSLARAFGLPRATAVLAAALWLLNFHGIRMAVLWVSGRTALVLTLAAALGAAAFLRGRTLTALAWLGVALFAKEEAVLLPVILLGWAFILRGSSGAPTPVRPLSWLIGAAAVTGLYFAARSLTQAMTPLSAPPFYRPTFSLAALASNVVSYADRAVTLSAIVTVLAIALLGWSRPFADRRTLDAIKCGAVWLVGAFALTIFLPVRSDLYACFPSAGVCLIAAALASRCWEQAPLVRRRRALVGALVLLVAMAPISYARTGRWVDIADFASATLADLDAATRPLPDDSVVVVQDDRSQRVNLGSAFGTLINEAYLVTTGRRMTIWVEPPPANAEAAGLRPPCPSCVTLRMAVSAGRLRQER